MRFSGLHGDFIGIDPCKTNRHGDIMGCTTDNMIVWLVHPNVEVFIFRLIFLRGSKLDDVPKMRGCGSQANLNEDAIDGDSKTAGLLVLSMWKCWQRRCGCR